MKGGVVAEGRRDLACVQNAEATTCTGAESKDPSSFLDTVCCLLNSPTEGFRLPEEASKGPHLLFNEELGKLGGRKITQISASGMDCFCDRNGVGTLP